MMALAMGASDIASAQTRIAVPGAPDVEMALIPAPAGTDIDAVLPQLIEKSGAARGGISAHSKPTQVNVEGATMRMETVSFNKMPGYAFFFLTVPQGSGICMAGLPIKRAGQLSEVVGAACLKALGRGGSGQASAPPSAAPSRTAAPRTARPSSAAPAAHAGNWAKVDGVYFRSRAGFGVGGGVTVNFRPIVLFKDGSFYETDDAALEDVDFATARAARPDAWGRWSRQGDNFTLTNSKGQAKAYPLQQGNFFKAYPAAGTASLSGSYKSLGGGGNTAFGGDVMIATKNRYNFLPGGTFSTERSTGATGPSSAIASRRGGEGRFSVDRYTISIEQPGGRMERRFFAFGSKKTPPQMDRSMLFIGDTVYTLED